MENADQLRFIDEIVIADEANPESDGMLLAVKHSIDKAPFFIVEDNEGTTTIYTIYFKFVVWSKFSTPLCTTNYLHDNTALLMKMELKTAR